jgi:putative membrane protein insertion efficiency factor
MTAPDDGARQPELTPVSDAPAGPEPRPLSWTNPLDWLALSLIVLVRTYQLTLSPILGRQCRFEPSCSRYFIGAVQKYGAIIGAWRGICRIGRCHPWHPGGYDPP